jgi:hypothetical protein
MFYKKEKRLKRLKTNIFILKNSLDQGRRDQEAPLRAGQSIKGLARP